MATLDDSLPSLSGRAVETSIAELLQQLVPPREFAGARFSNYIADPSHPSQSEASSACQAFAQGKKLKSAKLANQSKASKVAGIYLDGGFGVGKTHLLSAIWHEFRGTKVFGSFLAYTGLIGVLGFANAVQALAKFELVCIDEFELDDPGDTMMLSRLLSELDSKGVRFAATSNTPPNALGQGRFAAADFAREISAMADRFAILTVDGEDFRHRPTDAHTEALSEQELKVWIENAEQQNQQVYRDDFDGLLKHLATLHPSKYLKLIDGVDALALIQASKMHDQVAALRFVSLVDRLYENQVALRCTGEALTEVFSEEMIGGAYRKKYLRAISRLGALSSL